MATQNLTRTLNRNNKKAHRVFYAELDYTDDIGTSADIYELFVLSEKSNITKAEIYVITPSDAATSAVANVGFSGKTKSS